MVAKLVAEEGDLKGLVLSFEEGDSWVIGRDPDQCQLIVEDALASRRHLIAKKTPAGISVENLSSTNPTQINEEKIDKPRLLQNGDMIKIGNESFRYYADASAHIVEDEANPNGKENEIEEEDDTVFHPDSEKAHPDVVDINFGVMETGRWLLKVIAGPNMGAEFFMQTGHSYVIGTDPHTCDIVFHDTSVSRQHARVSVTEDDILTIEDLKSRNGILINNEKLEGKQTLIPSMIVMMGTSSFVVYDREGEMQTIISPLLPSIVKVLQHDEAHRQEEELIEKEVEEKKPVEPLPVLTPEPKQRAWGPIILLATLIGILGLGSLATFSLFKSEPVVEHVQQNPTQFIDQVMASFPAVKYSYNSTNGSLLLLGHVSTSADKNQLMYNLESLNFIKNVDDSGLIIDELVWREINSILARNPAYQGISIHSPAAGEFVLSGYLQTRKQAEQLSDYLSVNFPYLDLLKNQVIVEEDMLGQIKSWLQHARIPNVIPKLSNGEISLTGAVPEDQTQAYSEILQNIKNIPGVRVVNDLSHAQAPQMGIVNISDQYEVSGQSKLGDKYTVVINGRIVSKGDIIDGMGITKITPNTIFLEKEGTKYRIDYNK